MASRFAPRIAILGRALAQRIASSVASSADQSRRRTRPGQPGRILIAHHLLLGDTLMLTPLLAKLREMYPRADVAMTVPRACAALYAGRPYGVRPLEWNPRDTASIARLFREPAFDLALIPGDNRHSWLAQAMGARWIVAFGGDRPGYKSWPVDELRDYPATPGTWYDITATLVDGPAPAPFRPGDWPAPAVVEMPPIPESPYCVLHVGASSALKLWEPSRWQALAGYLRSRGLRIAWSAGPGEEQLVAACAPPAGDVVTAGRFDLAALWHLLHRASLVVAPDTGIAHLARIAGTPTLALFGPGSALLAGTGAFWRDSAYRALTVEPFACRDQHLLFKREVDWVNICKRSSAQCSSPRCMAAIGIDEVLDACEQLLEKNTGRTVYRV